MQEELDSIILDFNSESLFFLNLTLAVIMFGVALNITVSDFLRIIKNPKRRINWGFISIYIASSIHFFISDCHTTYS